MTEDELRQVSLGRCPEALGEVTICLETPLEGFSENVVFNPKFKIKQSVNLLQGAIVAGPTSEGEFSMFLDFTDTDFDEAIEVVQDYLGEKTSRQVSLIVLSIISALVDGQIEPDVAYSIYPAVHLN